MFMKEKQELFKTDYGYFIEDGKEFIITRPDTPRPWANVICPGDYGLVITQSGSGYSWRTHASLNRITRWNQDLVCDDWGKYIYIRDEETGQFWSATWKPVCLTPEHYSCSHGFGYTKFNSKNFSIQSELTIFVPPKEPLEIWQLKLTNHSNQKRFLSLWSYFEWCLGESPDSHREFHRTFLETESDQPNGILYASKRLWTIANAKGQHWNKSWDYLAWHGTNLPLKDCSGNKDSFIGKYHGFQNPNALITGSYTGKTTGKWDDSIASLCSSIELLPGETKTVIWTLGAAKNKNEAKNLANKYKEQNNVDQAFKETVQFWQSVLEKSTVATPDSSFNLLGNFWLKYQALSGRIWGRTGYYQAGGAFGYRDQLQDSQIFLHLEPKRTKNQILLHAAHQYPSGIVHHWWHPITDEGHKSRYSDDLLWLAFVTINYLKETGDFSILKEKAPFLKEGNQKETAPASIYQHCVLAIENSLKRKSKRGLPLIGTGDWNDGLSVAGWEEKGESVWVAQFLYGILNEFCELIARGTKNKTLSSSENKKIVKYKKEAEKLYQAVNKFGWDGQWYWAASCDDGSLVGSKKSKEGKIHLNPQTWAVLNKMVPEKNLKSLLESLEKNLYKDYGPLLLYPAYKIPDERIGYLTRYASGVRENGGLYTHAGIWAIQMECFLKRNETAWQLFKKISPIDRGMNPDLYMAEPYVTPGNVDGPDSPYYGRGGWTWYTGSAAWLYRIMLEWIIGIRPEWEGLKIAPCVPRGWDEFKIKRIYNGKSCIFQFKRDKNLEENKVVIVLNDKTLPSDTISPSLVKKAEENFIINFN